MPVNHTDALCPHRPERLLENGITDGCECHVVLGMKPRSREQQPGLEAAELSLQPHKLTMFEGKTLKTPIVTHDHRR